METMAISPISRVRVLLADGPAVRPAPTRTITDYRSVRSASIYATIVDASIPVWPSRASTAALFARSCCAPTSLLPARRRSLSTSAAATSHHAHIFMPLDSRDLSVRCERRQFGGRQAGSRPRVARTRSVGEASGPTGTAGAQMPSAYNASPQVSTSASSSSAVASSTVHS